MFRKYIWKTKEGRTLYDILILSVHRYRCLHIHIYNKGGGPADLCGRTVFLFAIAVEKCFSIG